MEGQRLLPDLLAGARRAAAARTRGHVYALPPGEWDFRLDGPPDQDISFAPTPDFVCGERNGRLYLRMGEIWFGRAAEEWNKLCLALPKEICTADVFLCAGLWQKTFPATDVMEHAHLLRRCMELPRLTRAGGRALEEEYGRIADLLRRANARALAKGQSRYALRACAGAVLFSLNKE